MKNHAKISFLRAAIETLFPAVKETRLRREERERHQADMISEAKKLRGWHDTLGLGHKT